MDVMENDDGRDSSDGVAAWEEVSCTSDGDLTPSGGDLAPADCNWLCDVTSSLEETHNAEIVI